MLLTKKIKNVAKKPLLKVVLIRFKQWARNFSGEGLFFLYGRENLGGFGIFS